MAAPPFRALRPVPVVLALAAAAFALWTLVRHGMAIPASADDFCNRLDALHGPFLDELRRSYIRWSGRVLTTAVLYATFRAVDLPDAWIVSAAMPVVLLAACWLFAAALRRERDALRIVLAAFLFCALPLGLYPLTGQTVFWPTGGIVYLVPLLVLAAWCALLARLVDGRSAPGGVPAAFALGLLAGNAIELVWAPLAVVGALAYRRAPSPDARRPIAASLAGVAVGALALAVAPGNFRRAGHTPRSFDTDVAWLAGEYARMAGEVFAQGGLLTALAAALAVAGALLVRRGAPQALGLPAALVVSAFGSLVPMLAAPPQFAPRAGFYLLVLLFGAAVAFALPGLAARRFGGAALAVAAVACALALGDRFRADTQIAEVMRARWQARDAALRTAAAAGERSVTLPRLGVYPSPSIHALELADDPERWDNRCVAKYYGLDAISVPPPP